MGVSIGIFTAGILGLILWRFATRRYVVPIFVYCDTFDQYSKNHYIPSHLLLVDSLFSVNPQLFSSPKTYKISKQLKKNEQIVEDGSAINSIRTEKMCVGMMPKNKWCKGDSSVMKRSK